MMATWHEVDEVRQAEPSLPMAEIAKKLRCNAGYVRATFHRKGWPIPPRRSAKKNEAVLADFLAGATFAQVAAMHGLTASAVAWQVTRWLPEREKRPRGRKRVVMTAADLWGAA